MGKTRNFEKKEGKHYEEKDPIIICCIPAGNGAVSLLKQYERKDGDPKHRWDSAGKRKHRGNYTG